MPRAEAFGQAKLEVVAPAGRTHAVAGLVGDDPQQPRAQLGAGPKAIKRTERLDKAFLGRVLGVRGGARHDISGAERDVLVALHDLLVGGRVATLRACDQVGIVRWPALHRNASCTPGAASWFHCNRPDLLCVVEADGGYGARVRTPGSR